MHEETHGQHDVSVADLAQQLSVVWDFKWLLLLPGEYQWGTGSAMETSRTAAE